MDCYGGEWKDSIVSVTGNPLGDWSIDAGEEGLEKEVLEDILILIKYTATPA